MRNSFVIFDAIREGNTEILETALRDGWNPNILIPTVRGNSFPNNVYTPVKNFEQNYLDRIYAFDTSLCMQSSQYHQIIIAVRSLCSYCQQGTDFV